MSNLIVQEKPKSPISEAYRTLRTNLQFASFDKEMKVIVITSSGPQEGKSTTVSNLALAFAETSKKVLLVDCDLRRPTIHKKFNISNKIGLSNILAENLDPKRTISMYSENLYLLPSGTIPPSPAEMLSSSRMKNFVQDMSKVYDIILVDSPPILAVTDAQILSSIADGVLIVASSGQVEREAITKAKDLLEKVNAHIIGVVLNKVEVKGNNNYGYYYYYSNEGEVKKKK